MELVLGIFLLVLDGAAGSPMKRKTSPGDGMLDLENFRLAVTYLQL